MRQSTYIILFLLIVAKLAGANNTPSLKKAYKKHFRIGVALSDYVINQGETEILESIKYQYNSIVAENCMKSEQIQPKEGSFDFAEADRFVAFGEKNNMHIVGHCLVWHSQTPDWFFVDKNGNEVSREILIERMRTHIQTLVGRYKGQVHGWDVVNEAFIGSGGLRETKWLKIIGKEYIELAFKFAHEADPEAELYYNDYGMDNPGRRKAVIEMVNNLQQKGIKIDGIGMQGHYGLDLSITEFEKSVAAFSKTGLQVMVTELDITVLPFPSQDIIADVNKKHKYSEEYNPYKTGLPSSIEEEQRKIYKELFKVLLRYEQSVSRVTFWGINDANSWKNNWPITGRTDYPLLFDRNNHPKPVFNTIINLVK